MIFTLCLVIALTPGQQDGAGPPPLSESQLAQIRKLAQTAQKETARLKASLAQKQRELASLYSNYALDEKRALKLEEEILELQRQLLSSYRKMQVELRTLIGEERFIILKQRLDRLLETPAPEKSPKKDKETRPKS